MSDMNINIHPSTDMSDELQAQIIPIIQSIVQEQAQHQHQHQQNTTESESIHRRIAKALKNALDQSNGMTWQSIVGVNYGSSLSYLAGHYLNVQMDYIAEYDEEGRGDSSTIVIVVFKTL